MEKPHDYHHIVPTSKDGSNHKSNKVKLDIRKHRALHMLFDNWTPVEQIKRMMEINATALTEEFRADVSNILYAATADDEYIYKNWVLRRR